MNRSQRIRFALAIGLVLCGLMVAGGGPFLAMWLFVGMAPMDNLEQFEQTISTFERMGPVVNGLFLAGILMMFAGTLYVLTAGAAWFVNAGEEHQTRRARP